ncbi:two-component sensor histidine kinase [Sporosarcina sp. NCCP-2222]|uniref:sensor histidine kinase n=1 Tax=Sporosarcina sp. NCCP-2222 TaxID=2935073 RepID=UPI0020882F1E|nr:HAMP domain-containing sensor histidine kinase [Sporosarcina sp. NCCP-2222]GKV56053.1 two-component sensor histidine kinase [Sporosarcina sp. NCCP-2222]
MKWKLTGRYLFSVLSIVFIVIFVNLFVLIGVLYYQQMNGNENFSAKSGESYAREFSRYLITENGQPVVSEEGIKSLEAFGGWLQVLDQNGDVVANALAPNDAPTHYSPIELVHIYKYMDDQLTTYYIGQFKDYSYLLGVKDSAEQRIVFMFNASSFLSYASKAFFAMTIADLIIAALVGLLFSIIITRPVSYMIDRISQLKERNFSVQKMKRQGIFKPVFSNLNDVSGTLLAHEEERTKLEKMREEWISNVSHDLKTPLASIQGYAELLREHSTTEAERLDYAEIIERKSVYMKELLDDFNLTMRLRNQEMPLHREETRIENFVREIVIDVLNDPKYSDHSISFEGSAPEAIWYIDRHLMKRAIMNFINNSIIHNNSDIEVSVSVADTNIIIEDNGKGIAPQDMDQIFDRYYRGANTENIYGTGLGLAISRDIVEAHGGKIKLSSEAGRGTKVEIQIEE